MRTDVLIGRPAQLVAAATVVCVPVVGVLAFGWRVQALLLVAGVETAAYLLRSSFEALFATRPTTTDRYSWLPLERLRDKRGHLRVSERLPPVYPRNVPFALGGLVVLVLLGVLAGLVALYARPPGVLDDAQLATVALAGTLVVGRQGATLAVSLRDRRYVDQSAGSLLNRRPLVAGALFTLLLLIAAGGSSRGVTAAFLVVFAGKLGYDLVDAYTAGEYVHSRREALIGGDEDVELPTGEPRFVAETDSRGVVVEAVLLGTLLAIQPPVGFVVLFSGVGVGLAVGPVAGVATALGLLAARALVEVPIARLQYAAMEYRVYDTVVVGYDRRLDAVQWRVPRHEIEDVRTRTAFTSRLCSTPFGSVKLSRDDSPAQKLKVVAAPERLGNHI